MIIGIMSDTHDHLGHLRTALEIFSRRNVEHIIHAGDFTSPFTWRVLKDVAGSLTAIFGNNDGDRVMLKKTFGKSIHAQPYLFSLLDRRIALIHEHFIVDALADSAHFDLVVYGHTHEPLIRRAGKTLVVNPGEVCGWLTGTPTAAVLDLSTMEAEIVNIS